MHRWYIYVLVNTSESFQNEHMLSQDEIVCSNVWVETALEDLTFSFSRGVFANGFFVCESNDGIGTMICRREKVHWKNNTRQTPTEQTQDKDQ